jgi:hypothetical protein
VWQSVMGASRWLDASRLAGTSKSKGMTRYTPGWTRRAGLSRLRPARSTNRGTRRAEWGGFRGDKKLTFGRGWSAMRIFSGRPSSAGALARRQDAHPPAQLERLVLYKEFRRQSSKISRWKSINWRMLSEPWPFGSQLGLGAMP